MCFKSQCPTIRFGRKHRYVFKLLLFIDSVSVKALYKSDMTFSERLYVSLDVDLCRIRLHDCLTNITRKPLLYVRDIVPRACFEGLTRLDKVCKDVDILVI